MNSVFKNALVWVLLGSALIFIFNNVENSSSSKREMISYSQFKQEVLSDRIAKVVYKGDQMTIFLANALMAQDLKRVIQYTKEMSLLIMQLKSMELLLYLKVLSSLQYGLSF